MTRAYVNDDLEVIADMGDRAWRGIYRMYRRVYGDELFAAQAL